MDTSKLYYKGFGYVGFYSQCPAKALQYRSTVNSLSTLTKKLNDRQYCYVDSEAALSCVIARLSDYKTVRANQLSFSSYIVAWSMSKPKKDPRRVLYTDAEGKEQDWS